MSREDFDIPEVFRRAMEEAGWRDGGDKEGNDGGNGGGDDDGGRRPPPPRPTNPPQINRTIWIFGIVIILLLSANWIVTTYTDWLWFQEIGYEAVWLKQLGVRLATFAIAFVTASAILLLNWLLARRNAIRDTSPFHPQFLNNAGVKWLIIGVSLFLGFAFASGMASLWEEVLLFLNRNPFGLDDPIFNRDIGFYLFELPVFEFIQGWLISLIFVALIGLIPLYLINSLPDIQRGSWRPEQFPAFRKHIAVLGGFFLLLWAVGYWFDLYGLLYSPRGVVFGASYTDMNASYYALFAQMVLMALTALAVFYQFFRFNLKIVLITGGLWLATSFFLGGIYPSLVQRYAVEPNELERERPYIDYNLALTRYAYDLEDVDVRPWDNVDVLSEADLEFDGDVVQNIRLWDYRPLQATYKQLQALRPYYQFSEIDIDRYEIDGQIRQVMLAGRELDKDNLPAPSWVNRNLEFTHGYGIVMNPVDSVTPDGQPEFFIKDLPPQSNVNIEVTQPEIYYGESTNDTVFVSSGREEFSYPSGTENVYTSYAGTGGVPLDSFLKRVAFAIRLGDANLLLSDEIDAGTRIQFYRQIQERTRQIAPFLALDSDPYLVVADGRLVWIQDAYTASTRFPFSTPASNGLNYIRNSVKIVIDAYNGTVDFYIADSEDPIIQTYAEIFPDLFHPFSEFPAELISHVRYPQDLFEIQANQYLAYHMTDTRVFYNKEDLWEVPTEILDGQEELMVPYYAYLRLREEQEPEYLLIQPFTPAERDNMISWMAARNDPEHYGELIVYELPKQVLVFGPLQIESRINQEPDISQQFSLWDQRGSNVIRGNLLVIPLSDSFLYVEPIYLLSDTSALPELKRVIVATDSRIAMRETFQEALLALIEAEVDEAALNAALEAADIAVEGENESETAVPQPTRPAITLDASIEEIIQSANSHFEAAEAAQQDGDWATYGEQLNALQQDLERLMELTGE